MPLPDCFVDDHLVEMFPLFDQSALNQAICAPLTETVMFCPRYLKLNNSAVEEYILMKCYDSFRDIFRIQCT